TFRWGRNQNQNLCHGSIMVPIGRKVTITSRIGNPDVVEFDEISNMPWEFCCSLISREGFELKENKTGENLSDPSYPTDPDAQFAVLALENFGLNCISSGEAEEALLL